MFKRAQRDTSPAAVLRIRTRLNLLEVSGENLEKKKGCDWCRGGTQTPTLVTRRRGGHSWHPFPRGCGILRPSAPTARTSARPRRGRVRAFLSRAPGSRWPAEGVTAKTSPLELRYRDDASTVSNDELFWSKFGEFSP